MRTLFAPIPILMFITAISLTGVPELLCQPARVAEIIHVSGTVRIKTHASFNWVDAQEGMAVKEGDIIKTEENSTAELAFGEGLENIINVFPSSQLVISRFEPGLVKLEEGRVFALIKKLKGGSTFEVRTPTAVAGARGTGWGVGFRNRLTGVEGFEESVYVAGLDERREPAGLRGLSAGWGTSIAKGGMPSEFRRLDREEMSFWRGWKRKALRHLRNYKRARPRDSEEKAEKWEHRAKILERVERETARTEELKRDRRTQGGASQGDNKGRDY